MRKMGSVPIYWSGGALVLGLDRCEVGIGRAVEDLAGGVEFRAVAGAVPGLAGAVPLHYAAEVRAGRRALVQRALGVAINGDLLQAAAHDRAFAERDLARRVNLAGREPLRILARNVQVL